VTAQPAGDTSPRNTHPNFVASPAAQPPGCICAWTWHTITSGPENICGMRRNGPRADCPASRDADGTTDLLGGVW